MKRVVASLPESVAELCLVRVGLQCRGIRSLLYALRLGRALDREAAEAVASGAGLLHAIRFVIARDHFGMLQYWESFEALEAWSRRPPHSEWWRGAVERMRTRGDFGIYHETFLVPRSHVETIYLDCRPTGLGAFGTLGEPVGPMTTGRGRLGRPRNVNI
jgi:hypothetical protein